MKGWGAGIFIILRRVGEWWLEGRVGWGVGVMDLHRQREMRSNVYFFGTKKREFKILREV